MRRICLLFLPFIFNSFETIEKSDGICTSPLPPYSNMLKPTQFLDFTFLPIHFCTDAEERSRHPSIIEPMSVKGYCVKYLTLRPLDAINSHILSKSGWRDRSPLKTISSSTLPDAPPRKPSS